MKSNTNYILYINCYYLIFLIFNFRNDKVKLFESAVILEELCKELVAILFVKYHHSNSA